MPAHEKVRDDADLVQFKLRFRENLRARLERAARENGNSINSEIVHRLARSVMDDALFGRDTTKALLMEIASQIAHAEAATGKCWDEDPATFLVARDLSLDAFTRSKPPVPNAAELRDARAKLSALRERRERLVADLKRYRALWPLPLDETVDPMDREYGLAQESQWRDPANPDAPVSDTDAVLVQFDFDDLSEVQRHIRSTVQEIDALLGSWRTARAEGRAIYLELTSDPASSGKFDTAD